MSSGQTGQVCLPRRRWVVMICDILGEMGPYELRLRRRAGRLTLAAVARAAGTSTSNVSAYERGTKQPSLATLGRLTAVIEVGADSPIHVHRLLTVPAAASAIRAGLRDGWPVEDLLRLVRELRSNAKFIRDDHEWNAFYAQPSTTGDRRWDSMLAGVTEMDALRSRHEVPTWARGHDLPHLWYVGSTPSLEAYDLVHTPRSLAVRGIVLDGAALESV